MLVFVVLAIILAGVCIFGISVVIDYLLPRKNF